MSFHNQGALTSFQSVSPKANNASRILLGSLPSPGCLVIALNFFFFQKKVSNDVPFRVPNAAQINMHWGRDTLTIYMIMSSFTDSVKHIYCLS